MHLPDGETPEYLTERLARAIGVTYNASEIHVAHRLFRRSQDYDRPPLFLIQFVNKATKQKWLHFGRKKKVYSRDVVGHGEGRVYVNENLTPYYSKLLKATKTTAKEKGYENVWVLNGTIRVKKSDTSRQTLIIGCEEDLKKLV